MNISDEGMEMVKYFEGMRTSSYQDQGGVWTIGYGRAHGVKQGDTCTPEQAEAWLREDLQAARLAIKACVQVEINQQQFDALSDFIFNLGAWAFHGSTLLKKLNLCDYEGAADEFPRWNKVNVKPNAGLTRRRLAERAMFLGKDWREEMGDELCESVRSR